MPTPTFLAHFNGSDGAITSIDSSASANALTLSGSAHLAAYVSAFGGSELQLSGADDCYAITSSSSFVDYGDFSIYVRFRTTQSGRSYATLISKGNGTFEAGSWTVMASGASDGFPQVYWADYSRASAFMTSSVGSVNDGNEHELIWDKSGMVHRLILDGAVVATNTTTATMTSTPNGIIIGNDGLFHPRGFVGGIDEVAMFSSSIYGSVTLPLTNEFAVTVNLTASLEVTESADTASFSVNAPVGAATASFSSNESADIGSFAINAHGPLTASLSSIEDGDSASFAANLGQVQNFNISINANLKALTSSCILYTGANVVNSTLSPLLVNALFGSQIFSKLKPLSVDAYLTNPLRLNVGAVLPSLRADVQGTVGSVARVSAKLNALTASAFFGFQIQSALPSLSVQAALVVTEVLSADVMLSALSVTSSLSIGSVMSINASLKGLVAASDFFHVNASLQSLNVIVTLSPKVMYSSYMINMKHSSSFKENPNNPMNHQVSEYHGFEFDWIAQHYTDILLVSKSSMALLGSDSDDGHQIEWKFRTGLTDFNSSKLKAVNNVYIGGRVDNGTRVSILTGDLGDSIYSSNTHITSNARTHRVKVGAGLRARYIGLEVENDQGGAAKIESIDIDTVVLSRSF